MMKQDRNRKTAIRIGMAVSVLLIAVGVAGIVTYAVQLGRVKQTTQEIREAADGNSEPNDENAEHSELSVQNSERPAAVAGDPSTELGMTDGTAGVTDEIPELLPEETPAAEEVKAAAADQNLLGPVEYPDGLQVNERIRKARKKSPYIMGWLKMDDLDEPVAQKDNDFFLDHDAAGLHNINGAIFMDENTKLLTRPYTVFLYGHNMKSGAMFGNLRKYRKPKYCQAHRDLSFETLYEEGQYEIFAVTMIRVTPGLSGYLNLWDLDSADRAVRRETISQLRKNSQYYSTLKVGEEDQLLLLITCEGDDDQRLVVAAKRVEKVKKENGYSKV